VHYSHPPTYYHTSLSIYKGDVVVLHKGIAILLPGRPIMIITDYDVSNSEFLLERHSNNRQAYPLLNAISDYSYIELYEVP